MKFFRGTFFAFLSLTITYALFFGFGVLCAFAYLAFFTKSPYARFPANEFSTELKVFLESSQRNANFNEEQINKSVAVFFDEESREKAFFSAPTFRIIDGEIAVSIPIVYGGFIETRVVLLSFVFGENLNLKFAYYGGARVPLLFAKVWGEKVLSHYQESEKLKKIISSIGKNLDVKIKNDLLVVEKCD